MEATPPNATTTPPPRPVVLYPTPGMGHLFAMVELGRTLATRGLAVTVIVVDPPYDTGAPGPFLAAVSAANPSISFRRLPPVDILPVASKHYEARIMEAVRASTPHLRAALLAAAAPTPAALVVDMFSGAALDVAGELGIPGYFFFTSGAACLAFFLRVPPASDDPSDKFQKPPPELDLDALLPKGFLRRTKGRGLVVMSWAPQSDVLAHGSVGGFVMHCGWNSVLEAVVAGVPMLGWLLHAEQRMNLVLLEKELKLAVALEGYDSEDGVVAAAEVAAKVRWLMDSDSGSLELRERAIMAMAKAKEALRQGGESEAALAGLVQKWSS